MDIRQPPLPQTPEQLTWAKYFQDVYNSCKCPNFRIHIHTSQAITQNVWTKLSFDVIKHNNLSGWIASQNYFKPAFPGYYNIHANISFTYASDTPSGGNLAIRLVHSREGIIAQSNFTPRTGTSGTYYYSLQVTQLTFLNGLDDYLEFYAYQNDKATLDVYGGTDDSESFASGFKISY